MNHRTKKQNEKTRIEADWRRVRICRLSVGAPARGTQRRGEWRLSEFQSLQFSIILSFRQKNYYS